MKGDNCKNPMDKNELGEPLPSRNQTVGDFSELTSVAGAPIENNQDSMASSKRGPLMLQDIWFLEKLALLTEK
jgi:catalase